MIKRVRDDVKFISSVKEYQDGKLKTEKQWLELGFKIKNKNITGTVYCTSREYSTGNIYFLDTEVKPMTEKQKAEYKKQKQKETAKRKKERAEAEERERKENEKWNTCAGSRSLMEGKEIKTADYIVLDTETTGFSPRDDEILQLSIIDIDGNILFNDYFQPEYKRTWDSASRVNGLYAIDVMGYRHFNDALPEIQKIIGNAKIVYGYNVGFDCGFLIAAGVRFGAEAQCCDVMKEYADFANEGRYVKLTRAAAEVGYNWNEHEEAHNALGDCFATLAVWESINASSNEELFVIREEEEEKYERRKQ